MTLRTAALVTGCVLVLSGAAIGVAFFWYGAALIGVGSAVGDAVGRAGARLWRRWVG